MKRVTIFVGMVLAVLMLCIGCAVADGGTYSGVDWDLTDGVLTLGNGGTQTLGARGETWPWRNIGESITAVRCNGTVALTGDVSYMFYNFRNMTSIDVEGFDTSGVTSMSYMFEDCRGITSLDLSSWDVSHVTNMEHMFDCCTVMTSLNVSTWNTSSLVKTNHMFYACSVLPTVDVSSWDMSHVTTIAGMFSWCKVIDNLNLSSWHLDSLTDMSYMFSECNGLTNVNFSGWDTSHVTNMQSIFSNCNSLTGLDLSHWVTSNVTSMSYMFKGCNTLAELNITGWNVERVTNIISMFEECRALTYVDVSTWNTSSVTQAYRLFYRCFALNGINVAGWDVSHISDMHDMFCACSSLTSLDVSGWDTSNAVNMNELFSSCTKLGSLDVSNWDTSHVTNMRMMFNRCELVSCLDVSRWDVHSVTQMEQMFAWCKNLESLDLSHWNTGNVTSMDNMFADCKKLERLNLFSFDTSNVTTMYYMFGGCSSLTKLDLSSFDTHLVTSIQQMFADCSALKELDISGFDNQSVREISMMYANCKELNKVVLGNHNPFVGNGVSVVLPTPPSQKDGVRYTEKWIREDGTAGPYSPEELRDNYVSSMAGTWVWEKVPTEYSLAFVCTEEGYLGEMPSVMVEASSDYELPANAFRVFGKVFDYWTDGTRRIYRDGDTIPANTYQANDVVTLTAVFAPRDTSIQMQDGQFTFSIKGDEKAFFDNVPAGTSYQVFEENIPEDWVLIMQSDGTGMITSLTESKAIFLNKYQPDLATIQFTGRKLMDEQPAEADSFTFELWEGNILLQTKSVMDGGFVQFDILEYDKNDVGIHTYTIKELIGTEDSVLYDGHEETIAVEVTTEEGNDNVTRVHAEVTYSDGTYPDIVFKNWTKPGDLTLKKLVDDLLAGHEGDEFRFRIRFVQENGLPLSEELTYSIEP